MSIITDAAEHIRNREVKIISESEERIVFSVKNHTVIWIKKSGRTIDSCDCPNHARFCNENPRCSHKLAASCFAVMKKVKF